MPVRRRSYTAPAPAPLKEEEVSWPWRLAAGLTRVGSGIAGAEGLWAGAAAGGGGEAAAQWMEGSLGDDTSAARIGAETALGAVPFGRVLKQGKAGLSAIRSMLFGGVGEAGRTYAAGEEFDRDAALRIGATAVGSGVLGGFLGGKVHGTPKPPTEPAVEAPPTAGRVYPAGVQPKKITGPERDQISQFNQAMGAKVKRTEDEYDEFQRLDMHQPSRADLRQITSEQDRLVKSFQKDIDDEEAAEAIRLAREAAGATQKKQSFSATQSAKTGPNTSERMTTTFKPKDPDDPTLPRDPEDPATLLDDPATPSAKSKRAPKAGPRVYTPDELMLDYPSGTVANAMRGTMKDADYTDFMRQRQEALGKRGGTPTPTSTEDFSKKPGTYAFFKAQGMSNEEAVAAVKAAKAGPATVPTGTAALNEPPPAKSPETPNFRDVMRFFATKKDGGGFATRKGAAGAAYGQAQKARTAGEDIPEDLYQALRAGATKAKPKPIEAVAPPPPDWQAEVLADIEERSKQKGLLDGLLNLKDNQKGAIGQELLTTLGLGTAGALTGAAVADDPMTGAVGGFAIGAGVPQILKSLGAPAAIADQAESMASVEGVKKTASAIIKHLPMLQRFNYLADSTGLPANAIAGPWGSIFTGGLEAGLSGDPRGWKLMQLALSPSALKQELKPAYEEAKQLVIKGETSQEGWRSAAEIGEGIGENANLGVRTLSLPGQFMTTGDVLARRLAQLAGFSPDEARRMTLTSEAEFKFPRQLQNLGKGSTLGQAIIPFRRTPVNIGEQGAIRTPGLGYLIQRKRGDLKQDLRTQAVQQLLLGPAAAVGGYVAGSNAHDPNSWLGKTERKMVSNLGGRYSLLSGAGFAAGQAFQKGDTPTKTAWERAGDTAFNTAAGDVLPLPSGQTLADLYKFLRAGGDIESLPRGFLPGDLHREVTAGAASTIPRIPTTRVRRIR